ncbi:hypothetical protein ACN26Y_28745 [Micromonospora sp. WMMD558]|uniref:hypothetical protein n=1 Tax=Micromonospora sp. WMMD558 TaxID=3403462 RepID=UPI003BF46E60
MKTNASMRAHDTIAELIKHRWLGPTWSTGNPPREESDQALGVGNATECRAVGGQRVDGGGQHDLRMRTQFSLIICAIAAALGLTACATGTDTGGTTPTAPGAAASNTAVQRPQPAAAAKLDAKAVLAKLTAAKIGLTHGAVQDEDTDPNNLLGRPNGYTSRASADLPGGDNTSDKYSINRGLVIEVFPSADDADRRATYIQGLLKNAPILGTEYHYRTGDGTVLVRVTGQVKPTAAKKIEQAVNQL